MSRLHEQYSNQIKDAMMKKFEYSNIMQVPKLEKIVINMGVGEAKENAKVLDSAVKDLEIITGQKAVLTRAKNSVANFKIREACRIGCKTTLRGEKMYDFMDDNPAFEMYPVSYINNPAVIAQHDNFVSVNSCIEVDLFGQFAPNPSVPNITAVPAVSWTS